MKSLVLLGAVLGLSASLVSGVVLAHGGATGIVKERMDMMEDMKESMKSMSDMFSGKADYDVETVKSAAAVIQRNSGHAITKLFPEGSLQHGSEAKPEIWKEWDRFETLALQLQRYSAALAKAAGNDRAAPAGGQMGGSGMMGSGSMMGSGGMMGTMMGTEGPSDEHLAEMPAEMVFQMVTDTCSSCHTRYRIEE
ncbi:putative cytochrome C-like protein [Marinobacterium lacunae]|uniref:Putative cytochrome C-like protein n=1 Tax=Marinobacterium lacunae TaxID=1232683 RepID=A0A081FUS1_9GAMM|nr:cytochrome c [Marinobacterium lacunae]KEA62276.1 putative cytochrome C-like protein [Marinobacterium lacunae]